jgi:iduronate 2-sulfatase
MLTRAASWSAIFGLVGIGQVHAVEPLNVYLLAGQSNMLGCAESKYLPSLLQQPQADVLYYRAGPMGPETDGWTSLEPGFAKTGDHFGPEITFGGDLADAMLGQPITLIKHAAGGTDLIHDWNSDDATGKQQYPAFLHTVSAALASLDSRYQPQIRGMVWMQGESDAFELSVALGYEQRLRDFIARVRNDIAIPNLPFVIGQIGYEGRIWRYGAVVMQAQANVSETVPNAPLVVTSDLPILSDGSHYNASGQQALGSRFAAAMLEVAEATPKRCVSGRDVYHRRRFCSGGSPADVRGRTRWPGQLVRRRKTCQCGRVNSGHCLTSGCRRPRYTRAGVPTVRTTHECLVVRPALSLAAKEARLDR